MSTKGFTRFAPTGIASLGWVALVLGALFPMLVTELTGNQFWISVGVQFLIFGIIVVGYDLLYGYTGLLSFGHAMFVGGAAYVTAVGMAHMGLSYFAAAGLALVVILVMASIVGVVSLQLTELYFAIITLAFAQVGYEIIIQFPNLTGGANGMSVSLPEVAGVALSSSYAAYYIALVVLIVVFVLARRVVNSPFGRVIQGVKVNEERLEMLGVDPFKHKLASFVMSGVVAGLAGILYPLYLGFVSPSLSHWSTSGDILIMSLIGGFHSLWGPVLGVGFYVTAETVLTGFIEAWRIPLGIIFVLFVLFAPSGIAGLVRDGGSATRLDRVRTAIADWRDDE